MVRVFELSLPNNDGEKRGNKQNDRTIVNDAIFKESMYQHEARE